ncbi:MAG: phospho-sugar mutase, partial [Planctomycetota bacterium]
IRDFLLGEVRDAAGRRVPLQGPTSNLLLLDLERPGYRLAIRPSGTEPKIKFYLFAVESLEARDLEQGRAAAEGHLDAMEADVRQLVV